MLKLSIDGNRPSHSSTGQGRVVGYSDIWHADPPRRRNVGVAGHSPANETQYQCRSGSDLHPHDEHSPTRPCGAFLWRLKLCHGVHICDSELFAEDTSKMNNCPDSMVSCGAWASAARLVAAVLD